MIKAVIFDMDGLILDSEILESQAMIQFLIDNGKVPQLNPNGLVQEIGSAGEEYYIKFKSKYQLPHDVAEIRDTKRAYFERLIKKGHLKPYYGFYELLHELKKKDFKLAVASNRFIAHINVILDSLEVAEEFNVIVGPSEKKRNYVKTELYLETAKLLQIIPEKCLALEDTEKGVNAAHEAGMKVIAVPNEYTKDHNFSKADKVVNSLKSVTIDLINSL